jgi:hypothetical protein
MGAFGELLVQRWGGNLDTYNENKIIKKDILVCDKESKESKEERIFELKILKARKHLTSLKSSLIYRQNESKLYTEDVIKNGFKKLGFNDYIQDKMWEEFCLFVDKHC